MQRQGLVPCSNEQTDARGHGGNPDQARIRCAPLARGPPPARTQTRATHRGNAARGHDALIRYHPPGVALGEHRDSVALAQPQRLQRRREPLHLRRKLPGHRRSDGASKSQVSVGGSGRRLRTW